MRINVLSLFDGMSCGQIALERAGIEVDNYFASEIDKYAIQITQKNYPNTIQLGDVKGIRASDLPKIDLLIGGSPCQGFSFAGKQLNFEDERSKLFFEYVRLVRECKPKWFLLENVKMKKEYQDVISNELGVEPILINSALVSAQNRNRLYWCNWDVTQPNDKGIILRDIIEAGIADDRMMTNSRAFCLTARYSGAVWWNSIEKKQKTMIRIGTAEDIEGHDYNKRIYSDLGKSPSLSIRGDLSRGAKVSSDNKTYRKLTPIECERLQTVPENYTEGVSNAQRYKMLGNGWTVDIIKHIFECNNDYNAIPVVPVKEAMK